MGGFFNHSLHEVNSSRPHKSLDFLIKWDLPPVVAGVFTVDIE